MNTGSLPSFCDLYLTFDDGPDPVWTPQCLQALDAVHAHATFFMVGERVRREAAIAREIVAAGHSVGNHTMTHAHPWRISSKRARAEVRDGAAAIADVIGAAPEYFRPPHGARRRSMLDEATAQDETVIMWNVSAIDWGWLGTAEGISRRLGKAKPNDIVLMHDGANKHNRPDQLIRVLPVLLREWGAGGRSNYEKEIKKDLSI